MAGIYPIPSTRTSDLLNQTRLSAQIFGTQLAMQRLQAQISTGIRLTSPSDDAPAAMRAIAIQRLLELKNQHQVNLQTSQSYLDATDTSISNVSSLLTRIRSTVQGAIGATASNADREAASVEIRGALEQILAVGNEKFRDRYLFSGSRNAAAPFSRVDNLIRYDGNEESFHSFTDAELLTATSVPGSEIFGAYSPQVLGTADLNPIATAETLLADLHGGQGVFRGRIAVSDGISTSIVDLSGAETLGDVVDLLQASPPAGRTITARITDTGLSVDIDDAPGTNLTIREVSGGTTAADLGIYSPFSAGSGPIVGADLDSRLQPTTRLSDILGSRAAAILDPPGPNNGVVLTARQVGTASNGVAIQYVDDDLLQAAPGLTVGNETVTYSQVPVAARAAVSFSGFNNNLILTASTPGTDFNNVSIQVVNAGAIGNNADINYDSVAKVLSIGIDVTGATTIDKVVTKINADGHFTATYDASDPADGGYVGTATIPASDAGVLTSNTTGSGGGGPTIFVNIQSGATTANHVLTTLLANADVTAEFEVSLDDRDTSSPAFAGTGFVEAGASAIADGGTGEPLDLASGLRITSGGDTYVIDLSGAETVEDLLNAINRSPAGVLARLNAEGTGINVRSRLSGTDFSIGENGGTTATQLGIRSLIATTPLSELNYGRGVATVDGDDFTIVRNDGTSFGVDISSALTIGDVLNLINNSPLNADPATKVTARLAQYGNGIELVDDNPVAGNQLQVLKIFGSETAIDLGLVPVGQTASAPSTPASAATATLAFASPNNLNTALLLTANQAGTGLNDVEVIFVNSLIGNVASVAYNSALKQLTVNLDSTATTANTIISAILAEGTFTAALDTSVDVTNNGNGIPGTTGTVATTGGGSEEVLTGADVNPLEVAGVFNTLLRLQEALAANYLGEIERAIALLDNDFNRVNFARAEVGYRGRNLDAIKTRVEDEDNQLRDTLSVEIDTDYARVIAQLSGQQAALEANLRLTAQIHQLTLLNFL